MTLLFRAYVPSDLPRLQDIRRAAFAPVFASFRALVGDEIAALAFARADEQQAALLDGLCAAAAAEDAAGVVVAEVDGAAVGFCCWSVNAVSGVGELGLNAVDPAAAGRGVGTRLYQHVCEALRARGVRVVEVGTGGDASHAPARRAYEKAGFGPSIPSVVLYRLL